MEGGGEQIPHAPSSATTENVTTAAVKPDMYVHISISRSGYPQNFQAANNSNLQVAMHSDISGGCNP